MGIANCLVQRPNGIILRLVQIFQSKVCGLISHSSVSISNSTWSIDSIKMISLGQKIKSKDSKNYDDLQKFLMQLKKKQEILKKNRSEDLRKKAMLNNMKTKVTNLLEIERFQVDLKNQNMAFRKNQEPEKMENQLIQCSKCDSIFYYQTVCYCSKPMSRKITENPHMENFVSATVTGMVPTLEKMKLTLPNISENPHLEKLEDFCDDSTATHYLNHFFDSWSIEILSTT